MGCSRRRTDATCYKSQQLALEKVLGEGAFAEPMVEDYTATGEKKKAVAEEDGKRPWYRYSVGAVHLFHAQRGRLSLLDPDCDLLTST